MNDRQRIQLRIAEIIAIIAMYEKNRDLIYEAIAEMAGYFLISLQEQILEGLANGHFSPPQADLLRGVYQKAFTDEQVLKVLATPAEYTSVRNEMLHEHPEMASYFYARVQILIRTGLEKKTFPAHLEESLREVYLKSAPDQHDLGD